MKSKILHILFITLLCYNFAKAQTSITNLDSGKHFRVASNASKKYLIRILYDGTDSLHCYYKNTTFTIFNWSGKITKSIVIDTSIGKYYYTEYSFNDTLNKFSYGVVVDTVSNDTLSSGSTIHGIDGFTITNKSIVNGTYQNVYKERVIDSSGYNIFDSSFTWKENNWQLRSADRTYYTFSGKRLSTTVSQNLYLEDGFSITHKSEYVYIDTTLSHINIYSLEAGLWSLSVTKFRTYTDACGSYVDSIKRSQIITYVYKCNGNMVRNHLEGFDHEKNIYTLGWDMTNKYDKDGNVKEYKVKTLNNFNILYFRYPDLLELPASAPEKRTVLASPNPAKDKVNIQLVSKDEIIQKVSIFNNQGNVIYLSQSKDSEFELPTINTGLYLLGIETNLNVYHQSLMIE